MRLVKPSSDGKHVTAVFFVQRALNHFYALEGDCMGIVHVDSIRLDNVCNNVNIHEDDPVLLRSCKDRFGKGLPFRKCFWNSNTVLNREVLWTNEAKIGKISMVELFDKKDCQEVIGTVFMEIEGGMESLKN